MRVFRRCSLLLFCCCASAQVPVFPVGSAAQIAALWHDRVRVAPVLPLRPTRFPAKPLPGSVSWLAFNSQHHLLILQRSSDTDPVVEFNGSGHILTSWGKGSFTLPHSIRVDAEDHVWTVDAGSSEVREYNQGGRALRSFKVGEMPDSPSPFRGATDIAFAPDGDLFISDGYGNARVLRYGPDGVRLAVIGKAGNGPGQFNLPHALVISPSRELYVADRENGRIEIFDLNGRYLRAIEGLGKVYDLALDRGFLWASLGPPNKPPGSRGSVIMKLDPRTGHIFGKLALPQAAAGHALAISPAGEPVVTQGNGLLWFRRGKTIP